MCVTLFLSFTVCKWYLRLKLKAWDFSYHFPTSMVFDKWSSTIPAAPNFGYHHSVSLSVCSMIILTLLSNILFSSSPHLLLAFTIIILSVLLKFIMKCKWDLWFSLWVMDPLFCSDATTTLQRRLSSKSLLHPLFWCTSAWIPLGLLQSRKLSIKGQYLVEPKHY